MPDTKKTSTRLAVTLAVTWVPVRDSGGRTHMEARWTLNAPRHTQAA